MKALIIRWIESKDTKDIVKTLTIQPEVTGGWCAMYYQQTGSKRYCVVNPGGNINDVCEEMINFNVIFPVTIIDTIHLHDSNFESIVTVENERELHDVVMQRLEVTRDETKEHLDVSKLEVIQIETGDHFWDLMDALVDDNSGFVGNKRILVDAFKAGDLWGVMGEDGVLPCLAVVDEGLTVHILWVHSSMRGRGLGSFMVSEMAIENVHHPLPESKGFWSKVGLQQES